VRAGQVRIVVAARDEELGGPTKALLERLRGALTEVGQVMDYRVFVFSDDLALGRAMKTAIGSISPFTADRAAFVHQRIDSLDASTARCASSATFHPALPWSLTRPIYNRIIDGDFSATVDFEVRSIPRPPPDRRNELSLDFFAGDADYTLKLFRGSGGDCYFFSDFKRSDRVENLCGFDESRGRLRLRRAGARMCADYFRDGGWHEVGCRDDAAGQGLIGLGVYSDYGARVEARFTNFELDGS